MAKKARNPAQVAAEKRRAQNSVQVLVRFSLDEARALDAARGQEERAPWIKHLTLAAAHAPARS